VRNILSALLRVVSACLLILTVSVHCYGQQSKEVLVKCRDGSVYRGKFIKEDKTTLQIVNSNKDTIHLFRFTVKKVYKSGDYLIHSNGKMHDTNGFFWGINIGFNADNAFTADELRSEHLEIMFGWRFNKRWTVANGIGSEFNTSQIGGFIVESTFASLFLYGRYYFTDNRQRLFAFSRLGIGSTIASDESQSNNNNTGGFQFQGGVGVHFSSRRKARFIISLGYYLQNTNGTQFFLDDFGNEVKIEYNILITRPIIKVGIEFR